MNKMIDEIKGIHAKDICIFKVGTFYHAYGRDAYILAYLFDYKENNKYEGIYEKAKKYVNCRKRIDNTNHYLEDLIGSIVLPIFSA